MPNYSNLIVSSDITNAGQINAPIVPTVFFEDLNKSGFQNLGSSNNHFEYNYYFDQSINAGAGDDYVVGGSGWDKIYGGSGDDRLMGNDGSDQLYGGSGQDQLFGGNDGDNLDGGSGNDFLYGGLGNDILLGGAGDDVLHGDNFLFYEKTGAGIDSLSGGAGNDIIYGDALGDFLSGGTGADRFVYTNVQDSTIYDRDQIRDFNHSEGDKIDLSRLAISGGRNHFVFGGSSNAPGSIHVGAMHETSFGDIIQSVFVEVDGYIISDLAIDVFLAPGAASLQASDFIL